MATATARGLCRRHYSKSRIYSLGLDELAAMDAITSCEVCGSTHKLSIDHCHDTGEPRGRICHSCNTALGAVKDNVSTLVQLTAYLDRHNRKLAPVVAALEAEVS